MTMRKVVNVNIAEASANIVANINMSFYYRGLP